MGKDSLISMWITSLGEEPDCLDKQFIHTMVNLIIYAYDISVEAGNTTVRT